MVLNLEKPLLFFDIESTGLNIASDSIIELSFVKILSNGVISDGNDMPKSATCSLAEDGKVQIMTWRVKPWDYENNCQRPISKGAQDVHGIADSELVGCKTFYEIVDDVLSALDGANLAGFNSSKFDLPMLAEELERVRLYKGKDISIDLHKMRMVDVQNIYHQLEPRNLKAAYRFYCGGELENAHSAEADTVATYQVLKAQLDKYPDQLKNDVDFLSNFSERQKIVDYAGRLVLNDKKEVVINFGKHRGKTAREVYETDYNYFDWVIKGEFTLDTKRQFQELKKQFDAQKAQARKAAMNAPASQESLAQLKQKLNTKQSGSDHNEPGTLFP